VHSNQLGPHEELPKLLARHRANKSQRPIAEHTSAAFEQVLHWLDDWSGDVIIDACCGVGESTIHLSHQYPNAKVIGIDKSSVRLDKHAHYVEQSSVSNVFFTPILTRKKRKWVRDGMLALHSHLLLRVVKILSCDLIGVYM